MIKTDELKEALNILSVISPSRTTMPILKNLMLETDNGKMYITSSDLETDLTIAIAYNGNPIDACVPANELRAIVATISEPEIEFEQTNTHVILNDGEHKTKFKYMPTSEFPLVFNPRNESQFNVDGRILQDLLTKAEIACSYDDAHPVLSGINLYSSDSTLVIQAADGYRASYLYMLLGTPDFNVIIKRPDKRIFKLLEGTIAVNITETRMSLIGESFKYNTAFVSGNFPEVKRLISNTYSTQIIIEKSKLVNAVRRAMVFAKNTANVIKLTVANEKLCIQSSDDTGENSMTFDVECIGEDTQVAVNANYILNFTTVAAEKVIMRFNPHNAPIVMLIPDNEYFTHLIMPMHIR